MTRRQSRSQSQYSSSEGGKSVSVSETGHVKVAIVEEDGLVRIQIIRSRKAKTDETPISVWLDGVLISAGE